MATTDTAICAAPQYYAKASICIQREAGYYRRVLERARTLAEASLDTACALYFDDQIKTIDQYNHVN